MLACRRDGWAARILEEFRGDKEESDSLMKITKGRAVINRHQRRNVFNTVSAQQYVEACTEVGFGPELHPDLEKCIEGSFSVACITNMVEEMVGYGKN